MQREHRLKGSPIIAPWQGLKRPKGRLGAPDAKAKTAYAGAPAPMPDGADRQSKRRCSSCWFVVVFLRPVLRLSVGLGCVFLVLPGLPGGWLSVVSLVSLRRVAWSLLVVRVRLFFVSCVRRRLLPAVSGSAVVWFLVRVGCFGLLLGRALLFAAELCGGWVGYFHLGGVIYALHCKGC